MTRPLHIALASITLALGALVVGCAIDGGNAPSTGDAGGKEPLLDVGPGDDAASGGEDAGGGEEDAGDSKDVPEDDPPRTQEEVDEVCREYCVYIGFCLNPICPEVQIEDAFLDACVDSCVASKPPSAFLQERIDASCEDNRDLVCETTFDIANVCACPGKPPIADNDFGEPCQVSADCTLGPLRVVCVEESTDQGRVLWDGGYCSGVGCEDDDDCGPGNVCYSELQEGEEVRLCLQGCDPNDGTDDCRSGYGCWLVGGGRGACASACEPGSCTQDAECDADTLGCVIR